MSQLEEKHITEDGSNTQPSQQISQPTQQFTDTKTRSKVKGIQPQMQLSIFESLDEYTIKIKEELRNMDLNAMTPIDALWKLNELKRIAEKK
jgi:DNA mismatch repair protein MutS